MSQPHDYVGDHPPTAKPRKAELPRYMQIAKSVLQPLASLRVTVILFVLSIILVFFGTLAQKRDSLNTVLNDYFYCWCSWLDLNLISDFTFVFMNRFRIAGTEEVPTTCKIPFPGGFLLGWAMVVNLTAAHIVRFKISTKRLGIWVLHAGVVVLLVGEYVRANYAVEDRVNLRKGQTGNHLFSLDKSELVFLKKVAGDQDQVVSVPVELIESAAKSKSPVSHPELPFDIKVVRFMRNTSDPVADASGPIVLLPGETNLATAGFGRIVKLEDHKEVSSVKGNGRINLPGAYVTLSDKSTGQDIGTYVVGIEIDDLQAVGEWRMAMRLKRTYLPYTITPTEIEQVNWPGTNRPKEFKSTVRIENPETGESRSILIEMNSPLRYEGRTYYQSQMESDGRGKLTGLQVVQNPGSHVPYWACILMTLGMTMHFTIKLKDFLKRRATR